MLRPLADEVATFIAEFPRFSAQITDQYAHLDLPPALRQAIDAFLVELGHGSRRHRPDDAPARRHRLFAGILGRSSRYIIVPVWAST